MKCFCCGHTIAKARDSYATIYSGKRICRPCAQYASKGSKAIGNKKAYGESKGGLR